MFFLHGKETYDRKKKGCKIPAESLKNMEIRKYEEGDLSAMIRIWNEVVEEGVAFPQEEFLDEESGKEFFASQSYCGVAVDDGEQVTGLYILHPNNVGRCGHICNASYAVASACRGKHIGEKLVTDCLEQAKRCGFRMKDGTYENICPYYHSLM